MLDHEIEFYRTILESGQKSYSVSSIHVIHNPSVLVDPEYTSSGAKFTSGWLINDGSRILHICPTITGHDRAVTEV